MLLGREVHNPTWSIEFMHFGHEHLAGVDLFGFACRHVTLEVIGKALLEH